MARADHLRGDVARLFREALAVAHGPLALVTVTQPGEFDNGTLHERWRAVNARIRVRMWREGWNPPRAVAWARHRQRRGADHYHVLMLCRPGDQRARVARWVELYRECAGDYGLGFVDDPLRRRGAGGRDMVFERPRVAGVYVARYVAGGQFAESLQATDHKGRGYWISPILLARSGWSLDRCRWLRQGWHVVNGTWRGSRGPLGGLVTRRPSWWFSDVDRSWVLGHLQSSGVVHPTSNTGLPLPST